MLTAIAIAAAVAGTVLDALTGAPVRGAVVTNGKAATAITDGEGRFQLAGLADARIDVIVQHPSYFIFAQAAVPVGSDVEIRLRPSSIEAEAIEIVETREEDLRPMLLRQDPIVLPPQYTWGIRAFEIKGIYRVCVGKDGKVSLVAALEQAGSADPYVKEGIAKGWQYRPLPKPACFMWRVTLRLNGARVSPSAPSDRPEPQAPPQGSPFRRP